jgi:ABC-type nickel/cobalt efflux system permease component RcnA
VLASTAAISFGLLVGARHAFEPDHLAAVSTLVADAKNPRGATMLGLLWGLGHTIALLAVGVALVLIDGALPARVSAGFELAVAAMLVVLGLRAIIRGLRNADGDAGTHRHGHVEHAHRGADAHVHLGDRAIAWRPLTIGIVHGLAGSGALTALAFAELPDNLARIIYMLLFGAGSIAGMAITTGVAGAALQRIARGHGTRRWLAITTGFASCTCGVVWAVPLVG